MSSLVTFLDTYNFSSIKHPDISEAPKVEHKSTWKNTSPGKKNYTSVEGKTAEVIVSIFTTTQIVFFIPMTNCYWSHKEKGENGSLKS